MTVSLTLLRDQFDVLCLAHEHEHERTRDVNAVERRGKGGGGITCEIVPKLPFLEWIHCCDFRGLYCESTLSVLD